MCRHDVAAYRMLKADDEPVVSRTVYLAEHGLLRRIKARCVRTTWTQHDPELEQRDLLPLPSRRKLLRE